MVLGLRTKNRKGSLFQVDYIVHVKEINPWTLLQSSRSAQSVLLHWENGDQSSGSLTSSIGNGKIEFGESFRLPVTLSKDASRKSTSRDSFQKNYLEFYLYEPRKDKAAKGQLLGSAIVNLADFGIIKETITISTPINLKKSSKNTEQPVLYLNIQPFDKDRSSSSTKSSLSKEVSPDKDGSESVSESINEGNDEESEFASFTDDDDDDLSSHSSQTVSSSVIDPSRESYSQHDKNRSEAANGGMGRLGLTLPSGGMRANSGVSPVVGALKQVNGATSPSSSMVLSSNPENPVIGPMGKAASSEACITILVDMNLDHVKNKNSHTSRDGGRKALRNDESHVDRSLSSSLRDHWKANEEKSPWEDELDSQILDAKEFSLQDRLGFRPPQDPTRKQIKLRSNTFASSGAAAEVQGGFAANNRQKHVTPVQLHFDKAKSNELSKKIQFVEKVKENDIPKKIPNATSDTPSEREETANSFPISKVKSGQSYGLLNKAQLMEKAKENDIPQKVHDGSKSDSRNESKENTNSFYGKVGLESKIEMLQEELREAAVVEASLYSVVAEHGSSMNKVHAPARRLSRFYLHACKARSQDKRAGAARVAVSGLILVSKACGNDVPRLAFWLSNSIVLRAIVSHAIGGMVLEDTCPLDKEESNSVENCDDWVDPQIFLLALEKFEAWIFSRIIESVWWQTLTPHMQSSAAKSSSSRKTSTRRNVLGDQEQGNFSIDHWKKAFKDACERLCPIRASGHECGCLAVLAKLVMEQLVGRLDVAMFNAILRESVEEMPTDPISDPISDPKVLPIPAGKSSFGAGVQLKNAVSNWFPLLFSYFIT
ncbi:hypothetical protein PTKIN_Ptkin02bG0065700 [Pterospermum kingtungense]